MKEYKYNNEISYKNDVYFKYALTKGYDAEQIRNYIIEYVTDIKLRESKVMNPEFDPISIGGKKIILDVHITDEAGNKYNIEMQTTGSTESETKRFIYYIGSMINNQIDEGNQYETLKAIYQIIFIDASSPSNHNLINRYQLLNKNGEAPSNISFINQIIISFNEINKIAQRKGGVLELDEFEQMCYLFKNDECHDIIKTKKRLVKKLMEKHQKMHDDSNLWTIARQRQIGERRYVNILNDKYKEGHIEGKTKGISEIALNFIQSKYHEDASEWLSTLSLNQLEQLSANILDCNTLDELKKVIDF